MKRYFLFFIIFISILSSCRAPTSAAPSYTAIFPFSWPLEIPTDEQINEVMICNSETIAGNRYPDELGSGDLFDAYNLETACDWAVLSTAYFQRLETDEPIPEASKNTFAQAILLNPAFVFDYSLFHYFFNVIPLFVEAPPFSTEEITQVQIDYSWGGLGDPVSYKIVLSKRDSTFDVSVVSDPDTLSTDIQLEIDKELVDVLGLAFTDLIPIQSQFSLFPCTDNHPDWDVSIHFTGGLVIDLTTNFSNFLLAGGPWQTNIDGQNYMQYSLMFHHAILDLIDGIGLPLGQPDAWYCQSESIIEKAFPEVPPPD